MAHTIIDIGDGQPHEKDAAGFNVAFSERAEAFLTAFMLSALTRTTTLRCGCGQVYTAEGEKLPAVLFTLDGVEFCFLGEEATYLADRAEESLLLPMATLAVTETVGDLILMIRHAVMEAEKTNGT